MLREQLSITDEQIMFLQDDVARDPNNLALLLTDTDRSAEGEPSTHRASGIWEKSLGPDHPNARTVRENLEGLK